MPTWTTDEKTSMFNSSDPVSDTMISGSTTIYGEYVNDYQSINLESGTVASSGPAFTCAASAVPEDILDDTVTISGVSYTVTGIEPDGTGLTILRLKEA
jgi:hypothetical protein